MAREIEYGLNTVGNFRLLYFATGSYHCTCCTCGREFIGDKRAVQCLACTLKVVKEKLASINTERTKMLPCKGCVRLGKCEVCGSCMRGKGDYFYTQ